MDCKVSENENNGKVSKNAKEKKNKTNEKLKKKKQDKVLKVRKMFQDRLSSKLSFFQSLEALKLDKTPRKQHGGSKSEARNVEDLVEDKKDVS